MAQRRTYRPDEKEPCRTVCGFDPPHLLFPYRIDHADIVLAAHGHPQLAAIRAEERLVRRTAHVDLTFTVFVSVSINVTEFEPNRNNIKRPVVRRKAETMHQQFATIQRTQRRRNVFAQMD